MRAPIGPSGSGTIGVALPELHMVGTHTMGNSSPFATHTVMTCTANASDSTRRAAWSRSTSASISSGGGASRIESRPATLWCWSPAPVPSSSATCSRSVSSRSPSGRASTRATTPVSAQSRRWKSVTPRSARTVTHSASCSWSSTRSSSPAVATQSADRPPNQDRAKVRARTGSDGRDIASSSQRHWSAPGDSSTLPPRASIAGMPRSRRASRIFTASSLERTSTAMSDGCTSRRPLGASSEGIRAPSSSSWIRSTRSASMAARASLLAICPLVVRPMSSSSARRRSRAGSGVPSASTIRRSTCAGAGSTSVKAIAASPKVAPRSRVAVASSTAASERQLVPSVGGREEPDAWTADR